MRRSILKRFGRSRHRNNDSSSDDEVETPFSASAPVEPSPPSHSRLGGNLDNESSVFSDSTRSTRQTAYTDGTEHTGSSTRYESHKNRLALVDIEGQSRSEPTSAPSIRSFDELIEELRELVAKMTSMSNGTDLSTAPRVSGLLARVLQDYAQKFSGLPAHISTDAIPDSIVSDIVRIVLGFTDVYLVSSSLKSTQMFLLQALFLLGKSLRLIPMDEYMQQQGGASTIALPRCFALGTNQRVAANEITLKAVIDNISIGQVPIIDQDGAYVAPVLRGPSPQFSVATLCIGIPNFNEEHMESVMALNKELVSLHVYGRADHIVASFANSATPPSHPSTPAPAQSATQPTLKAPYRMPMNLLAPPMSVSIAHSNSQYVSGTLGGFIYPKVPLEGSGSSQQKFAITCGHVCMEDREGIDSEKEPSKMVLPSPVLKGLFRRALVFQQSRYPQTSQQYSIYGSAITKVDTQPSQVLGDVIWGERQVVRGQMSDLAIIRCWPEIKCQNWLGDDVDMSQYDPALITNKLFVRSLMSKNLGLEVFKYGSTSKFTSGVVSSVRMAFWSSGVLQTSEFAVRGSKSSQFANGGDSGAWILSTKDEGLGVVGMLHSFDGEFKEFGLYTPIQVILNRMREISGVPWGVLGVPSDNDELDDRGELSDSA